MEMTRIDAALAAALEQDPDAPRDLLVRVARADKEAEMALETLGLVVRRRFRLVSSYAVRGPGGAALKLLDFNWVQRVEEDRPVHTM